MHVVKSRAEIAEIYGLVDGPHPGFTSADVDLVRHAAVAITSDSNWEDAASQALFDLADRIAALLPPEKEAALGIQR